MADGLFGLMENNQINPRVFWNQRGGVAGWGSICGALTPACAFIGQFVDEETQMTLVNELMAWYIQAPFPIYQPAGEDILQTVSNSTLCHVSITTWTHAAGAEIKGDPRKTERCGGLSGDVARFTVQMLNDHADGKFESKYKPAPIVGECQTCHGPKTQGKDDCTMCHTDPQPAELHEPFMQ